MGSAFAINLTFESPKLFNLLIVLLLSAEFNQRIHYNQQMALRIGILILASCNLLNADIISYSRNVIFSPRPAVSFPIVAEQDSHQGDHRQQLRTNLRPLGYNSQRRQERSPNVKVVRGERGWARSGRSDRWVRKQADSSRRSIDRSSDNSNRVHSVVVKVQKPTVVVPVIPVVVEVKKPVPVVQSKQVPKQTVVVTNHVVETNTVGHCKFKCDDDPINIKKGSDKAKQDDNHEVKQLVGSLVHDYNNMLNAQIKEIVNAKEPSRTPVLPPIRSGVVVQAQLRVAQIKKEQPIIVQKFLTSRNEHGSDCQQTEHSHSEGRVGIRKI